MAEFGFITFAVNNYLLQILFVSLLFCKDFEKKPYFLLRLIGSILLCSAFATCFPRIKVGIFNLIYPLLFFANSLILKFCFRIRIKEILIYDIAAAALQNAVAKFTTLFFFFGPLKALDRTVPMLLISDAAFFPLAGGFYLFFVQTAQREKDLMVNNLKFGVLLTIEITILFFLSFLGDAFMDNLPAKVTYNVTLVLLNLMVLFAEFGVFEQSHLEQENDLVEKMLELQKEQHQVFESNIELINRKCHDMRHQIELLKDVESSDERKQYLSEIEDSIRLYDQEVKTGNKVLDIILSKYSLLCEQNGVRFTYMADGEALSFLEHSDLYSFFGNALENALEALKKEEDETKRILNLVVKRSSNFVVVNLENYFEGTLELSGNLPASTKEKNGYHGYGLKSIRFIAEKYGGNLHVEVKDNFFLLQAIFPEGQGAPSH